jgi:transcriptional regulator with XRE-family HTH domain
MSHLAQRIRQRLSELDMSQRELASSCGVSAPAVNDWVSGKTQSLKASTLLKAAKALAVSPQWLENGVGVKSLRDDHRVNDYALLLDPLANQLHRLVDHLLQEDQKKLLEYAEMLNLKRLHDQKKQRNTAVAKK